MIPSIGYQTIRQLSLSTPREPCSSFATTSKPLFVTRFLVVHRPNGNSKKDISPHGCCELSSISRRWRETRSSQHAWFTSIENMHELASSPGSLSAPRFLFRHLPPPQRNELLVRHDPQHFVEEEQTKKSKHTMILVRCSVGAVTTTSVKRSMGKERWSSDRVHSLPSSSWEPGIYY